MANRIRYFLNYFNLIVLEYYIHTIHYVVFYSYFSLI